MRVDEVVITKVSRSVLRYGPISNYLEREVFRHQVIKNALTRFHRLRNEIRSSYSKAAAKAEVYEHAKDLAKLLYDTIVSLITRNNDWRLLSGKMYYALTPFMGEVQLVDLSQISVEDLTRHFLSEKSDDFVYSSVFPFVSRKISAAMLDYDRRKGGIAITGSYVNPALQGKGVMYRLFVHLIKNENMTIESDVFQSRGAIKLWKKLYNTPGVLVYGFDPKTHQAFHVFDRGDAEGLSPFDSEHGLSHRSRSIKKANFDSRFGFLLVATKGKR